MHSARAIANAILRIARESDLPLDNMQLQKLVYFAHGWNLALKNKELIQESVKAWNFGPVIPPLYNRLRKYGNGEVTDFIDTNDPEPQDDYTKRLLKRVVEVYGHMTGPQMSYLTHAEGTPWEKTWKKEKFSVIDNKLIREHFLKLKADANARRKQ